MTEQVNQSEVVTFMPFGRSSWEHGYHRAPDEVRRLQTLLGISLRPPMAYEQAGVSGLASLAKGRLDNGGLGEMDQESLSNFLAFLLVDGRKGFILTQVLGGEYEDWSSLSPFDLAVDFV